MGRDDLDPRAEKEGFTLALALVDAIPVLEFCISIFYVAIATQSLLMVVGALCCVYAGFGKVAWKLMLALRGRDMPQLTKNFMKRMLTGFALIVVGLLFYASSIDGAALVARVLSYPAVLFFALAVVFMVVLCVLRAVLDQGSARNNWIEQLVNIAMQTALLFGILSC